MAWAEQLIVCIRLEEEVDICLVAQQAIAGAAHFLADFLGFSLFPIVDAHFSFAYWQRKSGYLQICVCVCVCVCVCNIVVVVVIITEVVFLTEKEDLEWIMEKEMDK